MKSDPHTDQGSLFIYIYSWLCNKFYSLNYNFKLFFYLFWPYLSLKQILILFLLCQNLAIPEPCSNLTFPYKRIDLAQIFSLDQIDHGSIFWWTMYSNSAITAFLALSLQWISYNLALSLYFSDSILLHNDYKFKFMKLNPLCGFLFPYHTF